MTTITPPTAPQPSPVTTGTVPVVVVTSPPAALARLPIGQLLNATISNQVAKDVFQVQTPMGQLTLQSGIALPKGGALILQLQSNSPSFQFQINSLNGVAPPLAMKSGRNTSGPFQTPISETTSASKSNSPAAGATTSASPKMVPGNVLQATLLRPLSQPSPVGVPQASGTLTAPAAPVAGASAGKGMQNESTLAAGAKGNPVTTPAKGSSSAMGSGQSQGHSNSSNMARATTGIPARPSGYLPTGSQLSVKITGVQLPNPIATSSTPPPSGTPGSNPGLAIGTSLRGTVTGSTPSGHPIVQTRAGVFALITQTVVPRGSEVSLEVVTAPTAPSVKPGMMHSLHDSMFTSRKWPALEEVFQALQEISPSTAQQVMHSAVPRPNAALTAGVLFFMSALRGGEFRSLIGDDALRLLEKSRPNLVGRASDDFSSLARMADEPASGDWRIALIPVNTGGELEQIRLLLRQHASDENEEEAGKSDTRFVIDVQLSKFGRVQLDGLVRNKGKSLDLIVRTGSHFPGTMQNDIRTIFQDAVGLTGLKGSVNFQAAPPNYIDIADPSAGHDFGLVV